MEDEQIISLYWQRDERAIRETESKYHRYLLKIARNILVSQEDSIESVNDTYLAAWNSIPPHRPSVLQTYLGKLTRRIAIDIYRRNNREKRRPSQYALSLEELEDCIPSSHSLEEGIESKALGEAINTFLRTQPEKARNLFIARYFFLDSLQEAAHYCGMDESRAKGLLYRTRCALKDYLIKEGFSL